MIRESLGIFGNRGPSTAEQSFRFLARRVNSDYRDRSGATIIVVSPAEANGSAPLDAIMLAAFLADDIGARVLLIDSWLATTESISHALGLEEESGFADVLVCKGKTCGPLLRETAWPGVRFLPRGPGLSEFDRTLLKNNIGESVGSISAGFDFVVVVQDAVTGDTRGFEMIAHCSCVIIVARDGITKIADIEDQEAALSQNTFADVRVVLTVPEFLADDKVA